MQFRDSNYLGGLLNLANSAGKPQDRSGYHKRRRGSPAKEEWSFRGRRQECACQPKCIRSAQLWGEKRPNLSEQQQVLVAASSEVERSGHLQKPQT